MLAHSRGGPCGDIDNCPVAKSTTNMVVEAAPPMTTSRFAQTKIAACVGLEVRNNCRSVSAGPTRSGCEYVDARPSPSWIHSGFTSSSASGCPKTAWPKRTTVRS